MMSRIQPGAGRWWTAAETEVSDLLKTEAAPNLPLDLSLWLDVCSICVWIQEEILRLDWHNPLVVEHLRQHPDYRPKAILSLLCLGYSVQVFSSVEIAARCRTDRAFSILCEGKVPFPEELTRFRRKNRVLIAEILTRLFDRIWRHHSAGCAEGGRGCGEKALRDMAMARLDIARHMDACD